MQCVVNCSLKHIRPTQLNVTLARNNSALGCAVLEKKLNYNRGVGQPVKKVHQDNFVAPFYVTQKSFVKNMLMLRMKSFFDEHTGIAPTKMQQRFLVLTRMFHNRNQIPDYVGSGTMSRMHDRMRVVFIIVATSIFYVFFFAFYRTMAYMVAWNKQRNNFIHLKEQQ
ncbi:hypothetical protein Tcan_13257 [Toxocara canis]|uniref:Uncharacterized protein n=2 Tax=Toxocara canis TaxID=6265 RepID=A0A0B2VUY2_TOXCA|nr:hypothetical protein Tcan_13257 [Toxocara canis]VDM40765.1 unnamed protein product [Toxocara canis]